MPNGKHKPKRLEMTMNVQTRYDLPWPAWRALHSRFIDFVLDCPYEMQQALEIRLGGDVGFARFMLGIHVARVLNVATTIDGNGVRLGIAIPVSDGPDWILFQLSQREHGVEPEWLITAGAYRIDEELAAMLDGAR
jgi:hypothetical protein